jgi:hypothetical protein
MLEPDQRIRGLGQRLPSPDYESPALTAELRARETALVFGGLLFPMVSKIASTGCGMGRSARTQQARHDCAALHWPSAQLCDIVSPPLLYRRYTRGSDAPLMESIDRFRRGSDGQ